MPRRKTNEEFILDLKQLNNGIIALDEYINNNTRIRFQCKKNHIWLAIPNNVLRGTGCPYCDGRMAIQGETDLWTVRPDIAQMLKDRQLGYELLPYSHKKVVFICPNCGKEVCKCVEDVTCNGLACRYCGDGFSYPNRLMLAILSALNVEFKTEFYFKKHHYKYDFFLNDFNLIIEMQGIQHYEEVSYTKRTLQEEIQNDIDKMKFAISNGISKYITIDCRESNFEYIWDKIKESELSKLLKLDTITPECVQNDAVSSLFKKTVELWNSGLRTEDIANILHICKATVVNYLRNADKMQLTVFNRTESIRRVSLVVNQYTKDYVFVRSYRSSGEASELTGICHRNIMNSCKTQHYTAGGYRWYYDFNDPHNTQQND